MSEHDAILEGDDENFQGKFDGFINQPDKGLDDDDFSWLEGQRDGSADELPALPENSSERPNADLPVIVGCRVSADEVLSVDVPSSYKEPQIKIAQVQQSMLRKIGDTIVLGVAIVFLGTMLIIVSLCALVGHDPHKKRD